jgi:hypothetical protein
LFGGLGSLGGMFGGGGLGSFGTPSAFSPFSLPGGGLLGRLGPLDFIPFSGGGYTGDAPRSGGVDGEGGFPAILHPQETVIDHGGLRRGMNGGKGAGGGASPITLNVTATKIGDSEFVKVNDLQVALRESEKRSAAAGEQRTIARLKNSPQTRRNIGLR